MGIRTLRTENHGDLVLTELEITEPNRVDVVWEVDCDVCGENIASGLGIELEARRVLTEPHEHVAVYDHEYEPGDDTSPMHTDPPCRICGEAKH